MMQAVGALFSIVTFSPSRPADFGAEDVGAVLDDGAGLDGLGGVYALEAAVVDVGVLVDLDAQHARVGSK
jgi:hypothetical protein